MYDFNPSVTIHLIIKISNISLFIKLDIENHAHSGQSLLSLWDKLEDLFGRKCFSIPKCR